MKFCQINVIKTKCDAKLHFLWLCQVLSPSSRNHLQQAQKPKNNNNFSLYTCNMHIKLNGLGNYITRIKTWYQRRIQINIPLCLQVSLHAIFATSFEQSMSLHHSASELEIYSDNVQIKFRNKIWRSCIIFLSYISIFRWLKKN